jgi:MFS family permease
MRQPSLSPFWLLFILAGLNLFNYLDRYLIAVLLEPIRVEFGLTDRQAGQLYTVFMLGYFMVAPFFGYAGDRLSRKWLIASGILVWSIGTMLTGLAGGFVALLACRILTGFGEASYAAVSPSLISDAYNPANRNNAMTVFYLAIPLGAAGAFFVGSQAGSAWGWRWAFIVAGLPGLLLAAALLPFREIERGHAESRQADAAIKPRLADVLQLLRLKDYNLVVWGYVAYTFGVTAFGFWGTTYMMRLFGMTLKNAGFYFAALTGVVGFVSTLVGGFAATAWRRRNAAAYSLCLGISTLAAVPFAAWAFLSGTKSAFMVGLGVAIFLLFLGGGPVNTLIVETAPVNLRSSAMALAIFMIHLFGDFWSPEILGYLSESFHSLRRAAMTLPFFLIVSGGLWLLLGLRTLRTTRSAPAVLVTPICQPAHPAL